jgi:hypothetical protein
MDKDVEAIRRVLLGAIEERKRQQHKVKLANNVTLIGSGNNDSPVYISAEQRMSIMQLLMEFYRIVHRDQPKVSISDVCNKFLKKFKVNSLEFLTIERFDYIVIDLLDAINSYNDMNFDGVAEDSVGFQYATIDTDVLFSLVIQKPKNIATYLLGNFNQ